jgi:Tfp pilus assembly protein PilN
LKKHIDLLPLWAKKTKARKSLIKILAFVQLVIFLLLIAGIFMLKASTQQAREHYNELTKQLAALDDEPAKIAEELRLMREWAIYIENHLSNNMPFTFDVSALDLIQPTTPENIVLTRISYADGELLIAGRTDNLDYAETHRANLSRYFEYVSVGRINRTGDGYSYEIIISFSE